MPTMREEMERDIKSYFTERPERARMFATDVEFYPEMTGCTPTRLVDHLIARGWTQQKPYDSITDPNHPALAVTPAVALLENALELLRPHMYTKGGDASANPSTIRGSSHSADVTVGEGDVATDDAMTLQVAPTVQPGQESESEASAPSPESALRYSLGEPDPGACEYCGGTGNKRIISDVQTACSPEAINEVLEADFPNDAIEEKLEAAGREEQAFCEVVAQTVTEENVALRSQIKQIREVVKSEFAAAMKRAHDATSRIEYDAAKLLAGLSHDLLCEIDRITKRVALAQVRDVIKRFDIVRWRCKDGLGTLWSMDTPEVRGWLDDAIALERLILDLETRITRQT